MTFNTVTKNKNNKNLTVSHQPASIWSSAEVFQSVKGGKLLLKMTIKEKSRYKSIYLYFTPNK